MNSFNPTLTHNSIFTAYADCSLCPRTCHINRLEGHTGFCSQTAQLRAARAALHFWEEPIISGVQGSGTVFFSGCNLRCTFCQNHEIALGNQGMEISLDRLADIFIELQKKGAHNINLVTGAPYIPHIAAAIPIARSKGLTIPIVYNSSGYESVTALKLLEGLIDIYLPDFKYFSSELSLRYSHAADYFEVASKALEEMYRQVGDPVLSTQGTANSCELLSKGIIVRHLLLPGQTKDSKKVLRYLHETYHDHIYISIMNQYTPLPHVAHDPTLNRKVTPEEYRRVTDFAERIGITQGFLQEGDVADESFIPAFDYEGITPDS